jgi:hypothetical protein
MQLCFSERKENVTPATIVWMRQRCCYRGHAPFDCTACSLLLIARSLGHGLPPNAFEQQSAIKQPICVSEKT